MPATPDELLRRRAAHISPIMSIHYREPIQVVRGEGQYLFDETGRRYLDCINNVQLVGHSHPRVTEAVCRQLSQVNTNTRFLYEGLADYAERLTTLLPPALDVCYFVNSGSEANELALRLARAATRERGVVVLDHAYHGNTTSLVEISPYKFDAPTGDGRPPHVQVAPTPDPYRGSYRGADSAAEYAQAVGAALERAAQDGRPAGMVIAETMLGCAGQIDPPSGFIPAAYATARSAGAVVVADEVQIGFGRVGSSMWAFQAHGGVPDVVTLGKPIGNGYPLGAVVTTREISEAFAQGVEYFNTYGGSPVACAAGLAVLDVLRDEEWQQHAREVGQHLQTRFVQLSERHPAIGDVRGRGLFVGVDLVRDPASREPATDLAGDLVEALRREGILLSTEGPGHNVLKIKPPLPFTTEDADQLADAVDRFLARAS